MSTPTRDVLLEQVRGFALVLVVVGHALGGDPAIQAWIAAPGWTSVAGSWIYSFHMPLFVACAGAAQALSSHRGPGSWSGFLRKRADRLLVPFVLVAVFVHAPVAALAQPGISWGKETLRLLSGVGGGHLWFLWMLFWVQVLHRLLAATGLPSLARWGILLTASLGSLARGKFGWSDVLEWNHILRFLPWYALGAFMPRFMEFVRKEVSERGRGPLFPVGAGLWALHVTLWVVADRIPDRGNPVLTVMAHGAKEFVALAGCMAAVASVALLVSAGGVLARSLSAIDRRGMWIYLVHGPIQWGLAPLYARFGMSPHLFPVVATVLGGGVPALLQKAYHTFASTSPRGL